MIQADRQLQISCEKQRKQSNYGAELCLRKLLPPLPLKARQDWQRTPQGDENQTDSMSFKHAEHKTQAKKGTWSLLDCCFDS